MMGIDRAAALRALQDRDAELDQARAVLDYLRDEVDAAERRVIDQERQRDAYLAALRDAGVDL